MVEAALINFRSLEMVLHAKLAERFLCGGGIGFPVNGLALQASGLNTRRKPRPAKSFKFTVANSLTPWATRHSPSRAS